MLRISKLADYAAIVMVALGRAPGTLQNAKDLAKQVHLSVPTVSKCLKLLTTAGLLTSQLGAKGGYALKAPPEQISVAVIIQAVEGANGLTECAHKTGDCNLEAVCAVRGNWQLISDAIYAALDSVNLADLMQPEISVHKVNVSKITRLQASNPITGE